MDWIDIGGIVIICMGAFVFAPILLYYCYEFNKLPSESKIVKHRTKALTYYMNILSILSLIFETPFIIIITVFNPNNVIHKILPLPSWATYITASIITCSIFVVYMLKSWILFYNFQFQISLARFVWQKEVNPRYRSWFIVHKNKFGNLNYCICIVLIPFLLYIGFATYVERIILNDNGNVFSLSINIFSVICIVPSFVLHHKIATFDDTFGIKKEIFYQQIIITILAIILLSGFILEMEYNKYNIPNFQRIEWLFYSMIVSIVLFLMPFISVWYPIKLQRGLQRIDLNDLCIQINKNELQIPSKYQLNGSSPSSPYLTPSNSISKGTKSMIQTLSDKRGFDAFMKHLISEFATETLFFLMEYIQIKYEEQKRNNGVIRIPKPRYFDENLKKVLNLNESDDEITIDFNIQNDHDSLRGLHNYSISNFFQRMDSVHSEQTMSYLFHNDGSISSQIKLPPGLPKSELINKYRTFNQRLYGLYLKYIKPGSIHEINISYVQRQEIEQIFEDFEHIPNDKINLFNIMDEACNEILSLMLPSFNRFILNDNIQHKIPNIHRITSNSWNVPYDNVNKIQLILRNGSSYSRISKQYQTQ